MRVAIVLVLMVAASACQAANITVDWTHEPRALVTLTGPIEAGDDIKFKLLLPKVSTAVTVSLNSPGGQVEPALAIGKLIDGEQWDTLVPYDATCASACAFIWAAGRNRYVSYWGKLGFHAAYFYQNGIATERGAPNAVVGAYLSRLGYSDNAIFYMTQAAPSAMLWVVKNDPRMPYATVYDHPLIHSDSGSASKVTAGKQENVPASGFNLFPSTVRTVKTLHAPARQSIKPVANAASPGLFAWLFGGGDPSPWPMPRKRKAASQAQTPQE